MENMNQILKDRKIIIYGAGRMGQAAIVALRETLDDFESRVLGCAVTKFNNNPTELEGLNVREVDEYIGRNDVLFLIAARKRYIKQIENILISKGFRDYQEFDFIECINILEKKWREMNYERFCRFKANAEMNALSSEEYILFLSRQLKCNVINFEINVADHCNLNCQCCNHFSPLADEKFLDLGQYEKDLERLSFLIGNNTGKMMLLGGEPLLNPDIVRVMTITRKHLPQTEISVESNGLLLPKMKDDFWITLNKLHIGLSLTRYPVNFDYDYWIKEGQKRGVSVSDGHMTESIKTTYHLPIRDMAEFNIYKNYAKCEHANQCIVVREGRIYACPLAANVHYYNKYYNKNIPDKENVSIDIYGVTSWKEIEDYLKEPNLMCAHCDVFHYTYDIPWAVSKKDVKEWS